MRLTLDWDSNELKEMHLPAVRQGSPEGEDQTRLQDFSDAEPAGEKWELWKSSNHGNDGSTGWHYVEYDLDADLEDARRLRRAYGDDALRIALDGKRMAWGSPFVGVLYHMKNIKPREHHPYETSNRARLVERHGFDGGEQVDTKQPDGSIDYAALVEALAAHKDFQSRAGLFRRVQQRDSVTVATEPTKRGYDIAHGRRTPTRGESKALRDYAASREIGHYGEDEGTPEELAEKPSRTTFHEYWEMPEFEFGTNDFDGEESDSEWYPANFRTGTYDGVDEITVKQIHDRIVDHFRDVLSPSSTVGDEEFGYADQMVGRYDYAISLERDRPLDRDEAARYRNIWFNNQPGKSSDGVKALLDRHDVDPFGADTVHWELIIYDGENALQQSGGTHYWWIARGVLDASDPDAVQNPVRNSAIVADTQGFL